MSLEDLDLIDHKILSQLDTDARISYSALGKKIRVAKETVKYRIQLLQKNGIIQGYYTVLNLSKLGYTIYRAYIRLQNTSPSIEQEIIDYLLKSKKVVVFYRVTGPFNLALGVLAHNTWEYEHFWLDLKKQFGEYFSDYHFSVFTEYLEFSRPYFLPSKEAVKNIFTTLKKAEMEKLDKLDLELLSFLSDNARASLVSIAKKLNTSVVTARHRLKNLINKKVIIGFRPIFNLRALGREYYKVDLWFKKFDHMEEVRQHIISHPDVAYTERSVIGSDLEFDIETKNFESFIATMDSFKEEFPNDIRDYSYYSLIKNYKMKYAPGL
ncbi:AsnC family transcriptional regulator [Candidatus Micrarchaeota archaeon]|nr:AsnC family transcriptional regulator [Candidatus Micrarchaeota archaeon]